MTAAVTWSPTVTSSAPHSLPADNCGAAIFCCQEEWAGLAWRQRWAPGEHGGADEAVAAMRPLTSPWPLHCQTPHGNPTLKTLLWLAGVDGRNMWGLIQGSIKLAEVWALFRAGSRGHRHPHQEFQPSLRHEIPFLWFKEYSLEVFSF